MDILPMVRALKGCPISCLLIMIIVHQPVSAEYLAAATGYTDKPVALALRILTEYQLITRVTGGWMLSQAIQLQLPLLAETSRGTVSMPKPVDNSVEKSRNNSENPLSSCSSSRYEETEKQSTTTTRKSRNNSENRNFSDNLKACYSAGIRPPKAQEISALPHVTPEIIKYHVSHSESPGQAIYRIINDWPAPTAEQSRQKYVEGEFSDHIQH
jgi:predicted transcriptional regulator